MAFGLESERKKARGRQAAKGGNSGSPYYSGFHKSCRNAQMIFFFFVSAFWFRAAPGSRVILGPACAPKPASRSSSKCLPQSVHALIVSSRRLSFILLNSCHLCLYAVAALGFHRRLAASTTATLTSYLSTIIAAWRVEATRSILLPPLPLLTVHRLSVPW